MNEPNYKYLEWYAYALARRYNDGDKTLLKEIKQVCREHNADSKLEHYNRRETYYPVIEVVTFTRTVDGVEKLLARICRHWSCL